MDGFPQTYMTLDAVVVNGAPDDSRFAKPQVLTAQLPACPWPRQGNSPGRGIQDMRSRAVPAFLMMLGLAAAARADDAVAHRIIVSMADYDVPDVQLVRDDGKRVSLAQEMNDGRAVVLNFIFTTCTSFCPLSSQTFAEFQNKLGSAAAGVHLMSISVDPEQDTPERFVNMRANSARVPGGSTTRDACREPRHATRFRRVPRR